MDLKICQNYSNFSFEIWIISNFQISNGQNRELTVLKYSTGQEVFKIIKFVKFGQAIKKL